MFASHKDTHQDVVTIAALGGSVEEAVTAGVKELTEKNGHHDNLHFTSFEVVSVQGTIDSPGPAAGGRVGKYQVVIRAFGSHVGDHHSV